MSICSLYILPFFTLIAKLGTHIISQYMIEDPSLCQFFVLLCADKSRNQEWLLPTGFVFLISLTRIHKTVHIPKMFLEMRWWLSVGLHTLQVKEVQLVLTSTFLEDVQAGTVFNETGNTSLFRQGRHCVVIKIVHFFWQLIKVEIYLSSYCWKTVFPCSY